MTAIDPCRPVRSSETMARVTFIWFFFLSANCTISLVQADEGATKGATIRNAMIGEFSFRYVDNEYGSIVLSRAKSCYRNLRRSTNHFFTERLLTASASDSLERQIIVIRTHDSSLNIELVNIELSSSAGEWGRTSHEQITSLIFDKDADLSTAVLPALSGDVHPDVVKTLLFPVSDLELSPYKLNGFITHQSCYFMRVLERENAVNYLTLSDDGQMLTSVPTYSDLLFEALAAAN